MTESESLLNKIVREINSLPKDRLREVLEFVMRLSNGEGSDGIKPGADRDLELDPILKFIGGVSDGSLAHEIDRESYDA